ncbi:hypothetical protein [Mycoplasmopsis cynos]|uniref:hypothetical protein n=1 Tax=Mycoplasmopsis cynos TaxID=171284 RepID=UPI00220A66DB|nr:hypothetical protein [Mycoplasmopsis cynos]UWV77439.1 hypothetical protein NW070_00410 [Mycoplasmopsis cynos]
MKEFSKVPFGPGNKPDRDSDGNSYPMGIDLSRVKNIKTLRAILFSTMKKEENNLLEN